MSSQGRTPGSKRLVGILTCVSSLVVANLVGQWSASHSAKKVASFSRPGWENSTTGWKVLEAQVSDLNSQLGNLQRNEHKTTEELKLQVADLTLQLSALWRQEQNNTEELKKLQSENREQRQRISSLHTRLSNVQQDLGDEATSQSADSQQADGFKRGKQANREQPVERQSDLSSSVGRGQGSSQHPPSTVQKPPQIIECSSNAGMLPMGAWCLHAGSPHSCFSTFPQSKHAPSPSPKCMGREASSKRCKPKQLLCEAALQVSAVVVTAPRAEGVLNQTLTSLLAALSSVSLASSRPSVLVVSVRTVHPEFDAVRAHWEGRGSALSLRFRSVPVPSVDALSSSRKSSVLSPALRAALQPTTLRANTSERGLASGVVPASTASVVQQTVDVAAAMEAALEGAAAHLLLLEDDFSSCPWLPAALAQGVLALSVAGAPRGVWLSEGGNGFLLRADKWRELAAFLLHNIGGVSAQAPTGCRSTNKHFGGADACLQPLPVDWLIQDWLLANRRCKCCCEEDYAGLPPQPPTPRGPGLVSVAPSPFVHVGRSSTLAHGDARLKDLGPAALAAFVTQRCRPNPEQTLTLNTL